MQQNITLRFVFTLVCSKTLEEDSQNSEGSRISTPASLSLPSPEASLTGSLLPRLRALTFHLSQFPSLHEKRALCREQGLLVVLIW